MTGVLTEALSIAGLKMPSSVSRLLRAFSDWRHGASRAAVLDRFTAIAKLGGLPVEPGGDRSHVLLWYESFMIT